MMPSTTYAATERVKLQDPLLLKYAALAANYTIHDVLPSGELLIGEYPEGYWNPLSCSVSALHLTGTLSMSVSSVLQQGHGVMPYYQITVWSPYLPGRPLILHGSQYPQLYRDAVTLLAAQCYIATIDD